MFHWLQCCAAKRASVRAFDTTLEQVFTSQTRLWMRSQVKMFTFGRPPWSHTCFHREGEWRGMLWWRETNPSAAEYWTDLPQPHLSRERRWIGARPASDDKRIVSWGRSHSGGRRMFQASQCPATSLRMKCQPECLSHDWWATVAGQQILELSWAEGGPWYYRPKDGCFLIMDIFIIYVYLL